VAVLDTRAKYNKNLFFEHFGKIINYFHAKLSADVTMQYYNRVNPYPLDALIYAVTEWIADHKPTAGQIPTPNELSNACATWLNERPDIKFQYMTYEKVEDLQYPLEKLFNATVILINDGEFKFKEYCRLNRMPLKDIERVENKVRAIDKKSSELASFVSRVGKPIDKQEGNNG